MKLRIVDDWRQAWKWASVQLSAVSGTTHTVLASLVGGAKLAIPLVGVIPLRWVFVAGGVLSLGTLIGRLFTRGASADG